VIEHETSQLSIEINEDPTYDFYILPDRNSDAGDFIFDINLDSILI
jgi:hypothetical protein